MYMCIYIYINMKPDCASMITKEIGTPNPN